MNKTSLLGDVLYILLVVSPFSTAFSLLGIIVYDDSLAQSSVAPVTLTNQWSGGDGRVNEQEWQEAYNRKTDAEKNEGFFREAESELNSSIRRLWPIPVGCLPFLLFTVFNLLPLAVFGSLGSFFPYLGIPYLVWGIWRIKDVWYCYSRLNWLHANPPYPIRTYGERAEP